MAFNLVVHNVGNRPATDIRLSARPEAISEIVDSGARERYKDEIGRCFSDEGHIAVLHPGTSKKNGFGLASNRREENVLVYGASLPIVIEYEDLNARKYRSTMLLIVRDSAYFAGSGWAENS